MPVGPILYVLFSHVPVQLNEPGSYCHYRQCFQNKVHVYGGSYMSARVLLNLLNELGKKVRCEALPSILSVFPTEFNKFNNTGARMQDSI